MSQDAQNLQQQVQQAQGQQAQGQEEEPEVAQTAAQKAQELGVGLSRIEGSGADGRITVKDVTSAASP